MSNIFTDYQIATALLALSTRPIMAKPALSKKQRKALIKDKRSCGLKAWHEAQRKVKDMEATKKRNRSTAMKAVWEKRKAVAEM